MYRGRFIFAAALMLAAANARAATTTTLISQQFNLTNEAQIVKDWQMNGHTSPELLLGSATPDIDIVLTHNLDGEAGNIWTQKTFTPGPSFTMWADVNVDFHPTNNNGENQACPADGFAMAFIDSAKATALGGAGGSMGLYGSKDINNLIAFETNTWYGNAPGKLKDCSSGNNVTFEFSDIAGKSGARNMGGTPDKGGAYINQTVIPPNLNGKLLNGGWYRYQWDVDASTGHMDAFITGLEDSNKTVQNEKLVDVTLGSGAPAIPATGRFGVAAGTGGGTEGVHVRQIVVATPSVGTAQPPPSAGE
jgi:hypothetical protein